MTLYIYCAGGFGKELMDVARRRNTTTHTWTDIKFVDDTRANIVEYGAEVINFDYLVMNCRITQGEFIIANGEPTNRRKIIEKLIRYDAPMGTLVDPSSVVADTAFLESGVVITPFCSIQSEVYLAQNCCVNTSSIVGHDVRIGCNTVISSMVNIGGACVVGNDSYIGMGALIKEGVSIGSNSIIGMGSVVYKDVPDGVIALGNPARVVRKNLDQKIFK